MLAGTLLSSFMGCLVAQYAGVSIFSGFFPLRGRYAESEIIPFDFFTINMPIFSERFTIDFPYLGLISWDRLELFSVKNPDKRVYLYGFLTFSAGIGASYWFPTGNFRITFSGAVVWFRPLRPHFDRAALMEYLREVRFNDYMIDFIWIDDYKPEYTWIRAWMGGVSVKYFISSDKYGSIDIAYMHNQDPLRINGKASYITKDGRVYRHVPFSTGGDLRWDWRILMVSVGGGMRF